MPLAWKAEHDASALQIGQAKVRVSEEHTILRAERRDVQGRGIHAMDDPDLALSQLVDDRLRPRIGGAQLLFGQQRGGRQFNPASEGAGYREAVR